MARWFRSAAFSSLLPLLRTVARVTFSPALNFAGKTAEEITAELEAWYREHDLSKG